MPDAMGVDATRTATAARHTSSGVVKESSSAGITSSRRRSYVLCPGSQAPQQWAMGEADNNTFSKALPGELSKTRATTAVAAATNEEEQEEGGEEAGIDAHIRVLDRARRQMADAGVMAAAACVDAAAATGDAPSLGR